MTFLSPNGDICVKRVVGLPNETVSITSAGKLLIDGKVAGTPPDLPRLTFPCSDSFSLTDPHALQPWPLVQHVSSCGSFRINAFLRNKTASAALFSDIAAMPIAAEFQPVRKQDMKCVRQVRKRDYDR